MGSSSSTTGAWQPLTKFADEESKKAIFCRFFKRFFGSFPKVFQMLCWDFRELEAVDFQNPGFWRLRAPETRIWAPEGAFAVSATPKRSKRQFFEYFLAFFLYIWPLAGPNIAKRVGRYKHWRGVIGGKIFELLTFGPLIL